MARDRGDTDRTRCLAEDGLLGRGFADGSQRAGGRVETFDLPLGLVLSLAGASYRVLRPLGRGANGGVVLARDETRVATEPGEDEVVVKFAFDGEGPRRALRREADVMRALEHPGTVKLLRSGSVAAAGRTVDVLVAERLFPNPYAHDDERPLPPSVALDLFLNLLDALEHVHRQGFVHGDIKPSNILLRSNRAVRRNESRQEAQEGSVRSGTGASASSESAGDDALQRDRFYFSMTVLGHWFPVLGDSGSALPIADRHPSLFDGTLAYASPEALSLVRSGPERDVYALTASFAEMLTGTKPYARLQKTPQALFGAMQRRVPPFERLEAMLAGVADRAGYFERAIEPHRLKKFLHDVELVIHAGTALDAAKRMTTYQLRQHCDAAFHACRTKFTDQDGRAVERRTQGVFHAVRDPGDHPWYASILKARTRRLHRSREGATESG